MEHEQTPAQWWVNEMMEDADSGQVSKLAMSIMEVCTHDEEYLRSEMYIALAKVLARTLMDYGRSGRNPEHLKKAACELMSLWLDIVDERVKARQQ